MATAYQTEVAELEARAATIKALWVENLEGHGAASAEAKLRLGYLGNPAGRGVVVLLRVDGEPAPKGVQGLHPRIFHLGVRRFRAVGLADFAVDAAHRSLGPALMLMRRSVQIGAQRFDLTYGLPNKKSAPVCARAGLKRIGMVQRYSKPLATQEQLARRMPRWLAFGCAPVVDRALSLGDWFRALATCARLDCTPSSWDDSAFDRLWDDRDPSLLLSERTGAMLRWRFGLPGRGAWNVCIARDRAGQPRGYVVWRLRVTSVDVGDFFTCDVDTWTVPLMLAFARLARRVGAASISVEFFGRPRVAELLNAAGFALRPEQKPVIRAPGGAAEFDSPDTWYLTSFDDDAD